MLFLTYLVKQNAYNLMTLEHQLTTKKVEYRIILGPISYFKIKIRSFYMEVHIYVNLG